MKNDILLAQQQLRMDVGRGNGTGIPCNNPDTITEIMNKDDNFSFMSLPSICLDVIVVT